MENKTVYCIIVNWNGKRDTDVCLASLAKIAKKSVDLRVLVVDNGSKDDSVSYLRKKHPWIELLPTGANLGFTGGNNAGIAYARSNGAGLVWLLNNDTYVDKNVLSMTKNFSDQSVGICGSKIYFAPEHEFHHDRYKNHERGKVIWYAGGIVDWDNMYAAHRGVDEVDHGQYDTKEDTPFITGCSMMIRSEVFDRIGLLDDRFYLYLEDLDYSLRAKKAGFRLVYDPSSMLWHVNAGSSGRPGNPLHEYYMTRNRLLVGFRYAPVRTKFALFREALRFTSPVRRKAFFDFLLGRFGNRFSL